MLEAATWGFLAASSLVIGAILAFLLPVTDRALGLVLGFGSGVLMSTVAYELVGEAVADASAVLLYAAAFSGGAVTFFVGSELLARTQGDTGSDADGAADARSPRLDSQRARRSAGMTIVLGAVLDGIPESVVLGLSLLGGSTISVPVMAAIFISNLPEALGASADLERDGMPRRRILALWVVVALASGAAAGLGYLVLGGAPHAVVLAVQLFAGGAILAMLAESMVPEAFSKGGRAVGLATAFGFAVSATLSASA